MKKNIFLLLIAASLLVCCKPKQSEEEDLSFETEEVVSMAMDDPRFTQTPAVEKAAIEEDLSGKIIFLDDDEFAAKITDIDNEKGFQYKGNTPCIVDFYADWCKPCSALHPILVELAKEYKGRLIIYKVNTDKCGKTATAFDIYSIPTMLFFKRNEQPGIVNGALPKEELKKLIDKFLEE